MRKFGSFFFDIFRVDTIGGNAIPDSSRLFFAILSDWMTIRKIFLTDCDVQHLLLSGRSLSCETASVRGCRANLPVYQERRWRAVRLLVQLLRWTKRVDADLI